MQYLIHTIFVSDSFALGLKQDGMQAEPLSSNPSASVSEPNQVSNNCKVKPIFLLFKLRDDPNLMPSNCKASNC